MKKNLLLNKTSVFFVTLVVFTILFLQTIIPLWRNHLIVDIWFYFQRAEHFFNYQTLSNLTNNEHLPGALFYFFIPSVVFFSAKTLDAYTWSFFLLGLIFLAFHLFLYKKINGYLGVLIFLAILLFSGPILLFRFELVVSLLVLLSIYFFKKKRPFWSSLFLGIATTVKVYPILVLPYYLLIFFKKRKFKKLIITLIFFLLGVGVVIGAYFLIGSSLKELSGSFDFHAKKPLGLESPLTTPLIIFYRYQHHQLPRLIGAYGVWGIDIDFLPVNLNFFNLLPLAMVFLFYLFLYFSKSLSKNFKTQIVFLIFLIFLFFSKNLNPQYLFWAFSLLPIIEIGNKKKEENWSFLILFTALVILLLTQYVYPVLYTSLINSFSAGIQTFNSVVYLLFLRNFLTLFLLIISSYVFLKKSQ